jgi:hypothetical protein
VLPLTQISACSLDVPDRGSRLNVYTAQVAIAESRQACSVKQTTVGAGLLAANVRQGSIAARVLGQHQIHFPLRGRISRPFSQHARSAVQWQANNRIEPYGTWCIHRQQTSAPSTRIRIMVEVAELHRAAAGLLLGRSRR